jgi:hypothetical protein
MRRRHFMAALGGAAAVAAVPASAGTLAPAQTAIPRWRGFNLMDFFQAWTAENRRPVVSEE